MGRPQRIHYLSHNKVERTPKHVIFVDTETSWKDTPSGEMHTLRCWVARFVHRHPGNHRAGKDVWASGTTREELAEQVSRWARHGNSTRLYCHNTNFDLGVTRLPVELARLGWELRDNGLTMVKPWCRMRHGRHGLTIADSTSFLPVSIEKLAEHVKIIKPPLPDNEQGPAIWLERCRADVEILSKAMLDLMQWWDDGRLGCWSLTGPSTGWNAFRHIPTTHRAVIDPDPEARKFERALLLSGRREVWRVGIQPPGRFSEIDFTRAHLTVCENMPLPYRRIKSFEGEPKAVYWKGRDRWSMAAEVTVQTARPRYPVSLGRRVWYPVGTFRTTLAGPELEYAKDHGHIVQIHRGYLYRVAKHMKPWAQWLGGVLDNEDGSVPAAAVVAAKAWSRSVPGKWATRTTRVTQTLKSHVSGWAVEIGTALPQHAPVALLHFAGVQTWNVQDQEADDSFPAVLAWIQSYVRLALTNVIEEIGDDAMVSCNTDGLICRGLTPRRLETLAAIASPLVPRLKASYRRLEVITAAHIIMDGMPRLSGVPANAKPTGDKRWSWLTWPKLKVQVAMGNQDGYVRKPRSVSLAQTPVARWVLSDGTARPPTARLAGTGETQLSGWIAVPNRTIPLFPLEEQHPYLRKAQLAEVAALQLPP